MSNRPTTTTETTRRRRKRRRKSRRTRMGEPGKSYYTRRDIQTAATTPKVCCSCSCSAALAVAAPALLVALPSPPSSPSPPLLSSLFAFDFQCAIKMRPGQKRQRQFRIEGERQQNLDPVPATTGFYCLPLYPPHCSVLWPPPFCP